MPAPVSPASDDTLSLYRRRWTAWFSLPFGIMITGLIIGWLWLRTESIWLVAIAHGALNNWGQYAFKYMKDSVTPEAVSSDLAVLRAGFLALFVVGVLLLWRGVATDATQQIGLPENAGE